MKEPVLCCKVGDYPIKVGYSAFVIPINHPSENVSNSRMVRTSRVVKVLDDGFETENTVYKFVKE